MRDVLQHCTVVHCFCCSGSPREWSMISNQHHFNFVIVHASLVEAVNDLHTGLEFIVTCNHFIRHRQRAWNVHCIMIGMGSAKNWNVSLCLCPCSCVN